MAESAGNFDKKLSRSTEKLIDSLNSLEKSATAVGTVLGGAAIGGLLKNLSVAIPKAAEKLVEELSRQVDKLTTTIGHGTNLMRVAFQSLYVQLRTGITSLQSLFATYTVHRSGNIRGSRSVDTGRALLKPFAGMNIDQPGGPMSSTQATASPSVEMLSKINDNLNALRLGVASLDSMGKDIGNLRADMVGGLTSLQQIAINGVNIVSAAITELTHYQGELTSELMGDGITPLQILVQALTDVQDQTKSYIYDTMVATEEMLSRTVAKQQSAGMSPIEFAAGYQAKMLGKQPPERDPDISALAARVRDMVDQSKRVAQTSQRTANLLGTPGSAYVHVDKIDDSAVPNSMKESSKSGGSLMGGMKSVVGHIAGAAGGFLAAMTATTAALNPGAVEQLWLAFKDLTATIGVAFEPAARVVTEGLRQIAAAILPLMLKLRPIFTQLTQLFVRAFVPAVRLAASVLELFTPALEFVVAIWDGLGDILVYASSIIQTFVQIIQDFITSILGTDYKQALNGFVSTLQWVGQQMVLFVAALAAKLGHLGFVGRLIENFEKAVKPPMGGATAAGNTTMTSLDAIVKSMAVSAGKSGGFAGPSPEEEAKAREEERRRIAQETLDALREIQKKGETDTLLPALKEGVDKAVEILNAMYVIWKAFENVAKSGMLNTAGKHAGQTLQDVGIHLSRGDLGAAAVRLIGGL